MAWNSHKTRILTRTVIALAAVMLGLLGAEGFLNLSLRPELKMGAGARPGFYCPHAVYRVFTACAGREIEMRYAGLAARTTLNRHGYRGPFESDSARGAAEPVDVVLLGGASQGFGFLLNDDETFAAVAAKHTCRPVRIHLVSFAGLTLGVIWHFYKSEVDQAVSPELIIANVYWRALTTDIHALPDEFIAEHDNLELSHDSIVRTDPFKSGFLTRSSLFYALVTRVPGWAGHFPGPPAPPDAHIKSISPGRLGAVFEDIHAHSTARGTLTAMHLLPRTFDTFLSDAEVRAVVPQGMAVFSTHDAATRAGFGVGSPDAASWLMPDGHYGPKMTYLIGRALAKDIDGVLGCGNDSNETATRRGEESRPSG